MDKKVIIDLYIENNKLIDEIIGLFKKDYQKMSYKNLIDDLNEQKELCSNQILLIESDWERFTDSSRTSLKTLLENSLENNRLQLYTTKARL